MSAHITRLLSEWSYKTNFICPLQWELYTTVHTPNMNYHTGVIIGSYLYVHGGSTDSNQFSKPTNKFYRFHLNNQIWENLSNDPDCPALSNHASVVLYERYFMIIGGWNGTACESGMYMFDTFTMTWAVAVSRGLPEEMDGLACHTANVIKKKNRRPEILILVSNTNVRMHQTLAFRLFTIDSMLLWEYQKLPNRAYFQLDHAAVSIAKNSLHCIGGNFTRLLQTLFVYDIVQDTNNPLVSSLMTHVCDNKFNSISTMVWEKEACRGHSIISGKNGFIFLNGIKYKTNNIDYRKNAYAYLNLGMKKGFYYVGEITEKLAFGVCVTDPQTGESYYHGGQNNREDSRGRLFQLRFFFREIRRGFCRRNDDSVED